MDARSQKAFRRFSILSTAFLFDAYVYEDHFSFASLVAIGQII
jgi:hypothetical protein